MTFSASGMIVSDWGNCFSRVCNEAGDMRNVFVLALKVLVWAVVTLFSRTALNLESKFRNSGKRDFL